MLSDLARANRSLRFDFLFFDWEIKSKLVLIALALLLLHFHLHLFVSFDDVIDFRQDVFGEDETFGLATLTGRLLALWLAGCIDVFGL